MKPFALNRLFSIQTYFLWAGMLLSLSVSSFAQAAGEAGRDFNHMTTGYPLVGLHTTLDCGTCHIGGVFKGTPRNCSGCHTKGKRIVATTMSSKHIVTNEACEICHTNTVTFYGARFNHGKAIAGQCSTCHNSVTATGKPASHTSVNKATKSCDSCHRTYAWSPASWNHYSNRAACVTCHVTGGDGAAFVKTAIAGTSPEAFAHNAQNNAISCESCHSNYTSWYGAVYNHSGAGTGAACANCHNGSRATGTAQKTGHVAVTDTCDGCHTSTRSWLPALGGKPANHILYNTGVSCSACHIGSAIISNNSVHANVSSSCKTCHNTGATSYNLGVSGFKTLGDHKDSTTSQDCNSSGCHSTSYSSWNR